MSIPSLIAGTTVTVTVVSSGSGKLNAFFDWNNDGKFDGPGEVIAEIAVVAGSNNLTVPVPSSTATGTDLGARFRLSTAGSLGATGSAADGEVEDYLVNVNAALDFGDLPDSGVGTSSGNYQTTLSDNGPRHIITGLYLGAAVDAEQDGQPNGTASGDDASGSTPDDEDGVTIPSLMAGTTATVTVVSSGSGRLNAFFDWNNDGKFDGPGEAITEIAVVAGSNNLTVPVPSTSATGSDLGARFRVSTSGSLGATGAGGDGEVEDYLVNVNPALDLGDLPDTGTGTGSGNYQTTLSDDGPRHVITGLYLGAAVDAEQDGQPNGTASGDDVAGSTPDDEDGVTIPSLMAGTTVTVTVVSSGSGNLNAFFDWNNDGKFDGSGEAILEIAVVAGSNNLTVPVPSSTVTGTDLGARFRVSTAGGLGATGAAADGEVEDYLVNVNAALDFGDLPDTGIGVGSGNYRTTSSDTGPYHIITSLFLGTTVDAESDGQPNSSATGDDIAGQTPDDEDGVTIPTLTAAFTASVTVVSSGAGRLNAFFDWNNDGDFGGVGETMTELVLVAGPNLLSVPVPATAVTLTPLGARFRVSTAGGLTSTGASSDGEVEDYLVVVQPIPTAALISEVSGWSLGDEGALRWRTAYEAGTVGFQVRHHAHAGSDGDVVVSNGWIAALGSQVGGIYELPLSGMRTGQHLEFSIEELDVTGSRREHGPYTVTIGDPPAEVSSAPGLPTHRAAASSTVMRAFAPSGGGALVKGLDIGEKTVTAATAMRTGVIPDTSGRAGYGRIETVDSGIYFVSASDLASATRRSVQQMESLIESGSIGLSCGGAPVGYLPAEGGSGMYFYAAKPDGLYSTSKVFLVSGSRNPTTPLVEGGVDDTEGAGWHRSVRRFEQDLEMVNTLTSDITADYWMWNSLVPGNAFLGRRTYPLAISDLSVGSGDGKAAVTVELWGGDDGARKIVAEVKGAGEASAVGEISWRGRGRVILQGAFSADLLRNGANTVILRSEPVEGAGPGGLAYIDAYTVSYPAAVPTAGGAILVQAGANQSQSVRGFASADITILDVTDEAAPALVQNASITEADGAYAATFKVLDGNRYLAFEPSGVGTPLRIGAARATTLASTASGAEYVVIAPDSLLPAVSGLLEHRASQGLSVRSVSLTDIGNEFGAGIASPVALGEFVKAIWKSWRIKPKYVVLIGDGTFDYRDLKGVKDNLVPPLMVSTASGLFASDSVAGDVDGDGVPEVAVGRLPVVDSAQLLALIEKIRTQETLRSTFGLALAVADSPDAGGSFTEDANSIGGALAVGYRTSIAAVESMGSVASVRTRILEALAGDLDVLAYTGHGGHDRLGAGGYLTSADVAGMGHAVRRLPVVLATTCVAGNFAVPGQDALAEQLVLAPDRGAIAVLAPTGLSINQYAQVFGREFARKLGGAARGTRIGDLVIAAGRAYKAAGAPVEFIKIYNLMGDPAQRIR